MIVTDVADGDEQTEDEANTAPRSARSARNAEETQLRILAAAENEFACKGYDGTRLRDVAIAAGVNHALLHHYFGDKQGLYRAVLERALDRISSQALALLRTTSDIRELVQRYVDVAVDYFAENRNLVQILHFATLDPGSPAYAMCEEIADTTLFPLLEATSRTLERAQERGTIRADIEARRLLVLAMGAAAYVYQEADFFSVFLGGDVRSAEAREAHKRAVVELLLDGALTQSKQQA